MNIIESFSQCACMGGAAVGGITPVSGTTNIGLLKEDNLRATAFYVYSYGNEYFRGDTKIGLGNIKEFQTSFLGINIGYGITEDITTEFELYSFLDKTQDFYDYKLSGSGLSHFSLNLKYNLLDMRSKELEWTLGAGGKIPLQINDQNLPQHLQSSSGSYGFILQSFLHKGYKDKSLHFVISSRLENNFENSKDYQYGLAIINSLYVSKSILEQLTGIIEIRSDIRTCDKYFGSELTDSGSNCIILAPQINYSFRNFNFSLLYDYPLYSYYNGSQLSKNYSFGAALSWSAGI